MPMSGRVLTPVGSQQVGVLVLDHARVDPTVGTTPVGLGCRKGGLGVGVAAKQPPFSELFGFFHWREGGHVEEVGRPLVADVMKSQRKTAVRRMHAQPPDVLSAQSLVEHLFDARAAPQGGERLLLTEVSHAPSMADAEHRSDVHAHAAIRAVVPIGSTSGGTRRECFDGDRMPTLRQVQVLALVAAGLSDAQVGRQFGISRHTVRHHLQAAAQRAGAPSRTTLVAMLYANGLLLPGWPPSPALGQNVDRGRKPKTAD